MNDGMKCDRCGKSLDNAIYLGGDSIVGFIPDFNLGDSINLCKECNEVLAEIIVRWWEFDQSL